MRLWSLHPQFLDARGLVALWREALLAQAVLRGRTRGYRHHPQLERWRDRPHAICEYLRAVHAEALRRGYAFSLRKIGRGRFDGRVAVSRAQLEHEWRHLMAKLRRRDPARAALLRRARPRVHPLFRIAPGGIADWERVTRSAAPARRQPARRTRRRAGRARR